MLLKTNQAGERGVAGCESQRPHVPTVSWSRHRNENTHDACARIAQIERQSTFKEDYAATRWFEAFRAAKQSWRVASRTPLASEANRSLTWKRQGQPDSTCSLAKHGKRMTNAPRVGNRSLSTDCHPSGLFHPAAAHQGELYHSRYLECPSHTKSKLYEGGFASQEIFIVDWARGHWRLLKFPFNFIQGTDPGSLLISHRVQGLGQYWRDPITSGSWSTGMEERKGNGVSGGGVDARKS